MQLQDICSGCKSPWLVAGGKKDECDVLQLTFQIGYAMDRPAMCAYFPTLFQSKREFRSVHLQPFFPLMNLNARIEPFAQSL